MWYNSIKSQFSPLGNWNRYPIKKVSEDFFFLSILKKVSKKLLYTERANFNFFLVVSMCFVTVYYCYYYYLQHCIMIIACYHVSTNVNPDFLLLFISTFLLWQIPPCLLLDKVLVNITLQVNYVFMMVNEDEVRTYLCLSANR